MKQRRKFSAEYKREAVAMLESSGVSASQTKKEGHSTFSSSAGPCLCVAVQQMLFSSSPSSIRGATWHAPNARASNEGSPRPRVARAQETI